MTCDELRSKIDAFADHELTLESSLDVETHLDSCAACKLIYSNRRTLHAAIQDSEFDETASDQLRSQLMKSIEQEKPIKIQMSGNVFSTKRMYGKWLAVAVSFLLVGVMCWHLGRQTNDNSASNDLRHELFESDLRSLMAPTHGIDIISSNQHTVKPWFAGKLDFSPPVQDLTASGYPLLGGRRDYLNGRVVAALVYKRRQHWINLYIWPADGGSSLAETTYRGYNMVQWSSHGMTKWAISDLNVNELTQFAHLVQSEN